jgi:hypothetical protein
MVFTHLQTALYRIVSRTANENVSGIPEPDDGVVSLAEFKKLATHGSKFHLKSSALWSSVRQVRSTAYEVRRAPLCRY